MRTACLGICAFVSGCLAYVHSPPGRSFPLEAAKTLYARETSLQLEAGGGVNLTVGIPGFNLRVRRGIVDQLDTSLELGYQRINTPDDNLANVDRHLGTGRVGIKYAIIDHVALTTGLGGGFWAGGGFLSPDLSMIFAWENPYCVPFIDGGAYTSHPVRARDISIIEDRTGDTQGDIVRAAPVFTYGWTTGFGLRIPVTRPSGPTTAPAILLGIRWRGAYYETQEVFDAARPLGRQVYWYGSVGFEYVFKPRRANSAASWPIEGGP